ncbi:type IV pilus modification protein PilV [Alloalcanivorax mobilis]|uniref:type IV pilus modification protein PilV n=1 Tax=Alloalcanivorax mobilis TaxID=2019569 RepID=UPI000C794289|nr:type IV pilus modification protein PilV [Alloalcanivorax mobilis]
MSMMRRHQRGVGMVEILVALLVLAIGVLGYAGLQLSALKGAETAHIRARATALARDTLERMLVNPEAVSVYLDADSWPDTPPTAGEEPDGWSDCTGASVCDSDAMAEWDIQQLAWQAANIMPAGTIRVDTCEMSGASNCVVVAWGEQDADDCMGDGGIETAADSQCVVMEVIR